MAKYSFYLNKEEDKTILAYGELLAEQGLIERPVNRYKIGKYIFNEIIKSYKNKIAVVNQQQIIDNKTHLEKEEILAGVEKAEETATEEKPVEETDIHKTYKGLR